MKPAGNDTHILQFDNPDGTEGPILGVMLAADFTAEHEDKMLGLLGMMNIDPNGRFFAGRSMRSPVESRFLIRKMQRKIRYFPAGKKPYEKSEKPWVLGVSWDGRTVGDCKYQQRYSEDCDITGKWSGQEFAITGWTEKGREAIQLIEEGIRLGDLAIWKGGVSNNPFARAGLIIVRASLVPQQYRDILDQADQAELDLQQLANATGIYDKIEAANGERRPFHFPKFGYFALAPRQIEPDEMRTLQTAHPVKFFLNPMHQSANNQGWFTVEQLEQWLEGQGPIVKVAA